MKNHLYILTATVCLFLSFKANATRETGGESQAPRAVVIQGHLINHKFDIIGWQKARKLAAKHLAEHHAVFFTEAKKFQYPDRTYMCIEYKNNNDFNVATLLFKRLLANNDSIEVVENTRCH